MPRRLRSFIGAIIILIYIPVYVLVAASVAQARLADLGQPWQTLAYAVLGLVWVAPLLPLVSWMERKRPGE